PGTYGDMNPDRILRRFPSKLSKTLPFKPKPEDQYSNLAWYNVIIAFDPDWTQLGTESLKLLRRWVDVHGGGLIILAGPVHTFQLSRKANRDKVQPLLDLLPVQLQDARLEVDRRTTEPWALTFSPKAR